MLTMITTNNNIGNLISLLYYRDPIQQKYSSSASQPNLALLMMNDYSHSLTLYLTPKNKISKQTAKSSVPTCDVSTPLPNEYIEYKISPKNCINLLQRKVQKFKNPLYSQEALNKYFKKRQQIKYSHIQSKMLHKAKQTASTCIPISPPQHNKRSVVKQKSLQKMRNLINEISTLQTNRSSQHQLQLLDKFAKKCSDHYQNLRIEGETQAQNQFSTDSFMVTSYVNQLKQAKVMTRSKSLKQKLDDMHRKAHAQNIEEYIEQQYLEFRYAQVPITSIKRKNQKEELMQSWEKNNRKLRLKTQYCNRIYIPPEIDRSKIDEQIKEQCKDYMGKLYKYKGKGAVRSEKKIRYKTTLL